MKTKDYYQTLEIGNEASAQEVKEAYRKLALQYHPDRNSGDPSSLEKMKEINEAYAVLSDPGKRSTYDRLRQQYGAFGYDRFRQSYSEQDIFRGSDINQIFEELAKAFGFRGFDEVFRESYGPGYRTFEFGRPGMFGRGFIYFGPGFGRASHSEEMKGPMEMLPGTFGKITRFVLKKMLGLKEAEKGDDWRDTITIDPQQAAEGGKTKYRHWRRSKELMVTLPSRVKSGQVLRLRGMGAEGKNGGEAGDLYLKIQVKKPFLDRARELLKI